MSRLRVEWPSCKAHGLCAEVLPERIELDEWGYPIVTGDVTPELRRLAKAAAAACPVRALHLS
jgi:ferredoxin